MKIINISIKNYKGFLLSLMPLALVTFGLFFLSYIFIKSFEEILNLKYLFLVIFLGVLYFFYLSLKSLLFTLFGNHTILYNDEQINVETSVFKITSVKIFKWDDIETIGGFSPKSKPRISESLGIKPKDKPIFFFGHLIKDSKKKAISKELFSFFKNYKANKTNSADAKSRAAD